MGLFDFFSKKHIQPYQNEAVNQIYNLLFCDNIELYKAGTPATAYPWDTLLAAQPDLEKVAAIADDENLEGRQRILAYNLLMSAGKTVAKKDLLGIIVEVGLRQGLDVLAAFNDGSVRYINHTGSLVVWEVKDEVSLALMRNLFIDGLNAIKRIGPYHKKRKDFPAASRVRLTFLVSNGLYLGEGPFEDLQNDPIGGPVIKSATQLMAHVISEQGRGR